MGKCLLRSGQSTRRLLYKQMIFLQPQLLAPCSQKLEKVLFHCVHDVVYFCSTCGTECWEASSIKTTGPEKECAFVSSPRWTREFPSFARSARAGRLLVFFPLLITLICLSYRYGAQGLTLNKIVPHICNLLGDPTSQVKPTMTSLFSFFFFFFLEDFV